jgi:hypothetical protein
VLNFLSKWMALVLIVTGIVFFLVGLLGKRIRKDNLSDRGRAQLWFLQSLGFWAVVIGVSMIALK